MHVQYDKEFCFFNLKKKNKYNRKTEMGRSGTGRVRCGRIEAT